MSKEVAVFDYTKEILRGVKIGALVTTKAENEVNTMTISWGALGIEWNKPIFTIYIRKSRHTKGLLEKTGEFTVNIPYGDVDKKILSFAGTKSGRDVNKVNELGLTLVDSSVVSVPGIKELPLTLECKVIYKQDQDPKAISDDDLENFYPQNVEASFSGSNRDFHTAYYGEIVRAYIAE